MGLVFQYNLLVSDISELRSFVSKTIVENFLVSWLLLYLLMS